MSETFVAYYAKDRSKTIREQAPKIAATLRKNGRTPWAMEEDENHIIFKGTVDDPSASERYTTRK